MKREFSSFREIIEFLEARKHKGHFKRFIFIEHVYLKHQKHSSFSIKRSFNVAVIAKMSFHFSG